MRWSDERVRRKREEGGVGERKGGKEGWGKDGGLGIRNITTVVLPHSDGGNTTHYY